MGPTRSSGFLFIQSSGFGLNAHPVIDFLLTLNHKHCRCVQDFSCEEIDHHLILKIIFEMLGITPVHLSYVICYIQTDMFKQDKILLNIIYSVK